MPASTMLSGVAKSGSPISRWTIFLPWASSRRAFASTSKAPSVPRRDMRSANRIALTDGILVDANESAAVDAEGLPGDVARLPRAEERARRRELLGLAVAPHRRARRIALEHLVDIPARTGGKLPGPVGQDGIWSQAVDSDAVRSQLTRKGLGQPGDRGAKRV